MLFMSTSDGGVALHADNATPHRVYRSHPSPYPHSLCYLPQHCTVLQSQDQKVVFSYGLDTQQPIAKSITQDHICVLVPAPDATLLIGGSVSGALFGWDVTTMELLATVTREHLSALTDVAFSSCGTIFATASEDSTVHVHNRQSFLDGEKAVRALSMHSLSVTCLSFFHTMPWLVTGSLDRTARFVDLVSLASQSSSESAVRMRHLSSDDAVLSCVVRPDDGCVALGCARGVLRLVRVRELAADEGVGETGAVTTLGPFPDAHKGSIIFVKFVESSAQSAAPLLTASEDGVIASWCTVTASLLRIVWTMREKLCGVVWLPLSAAAATSDSKHSLILGKFPLADQTRDDRSYLVDAAKTGTAKVCNAPRSSRMMICRGHEVGKVTQSKIEIKSRLVAQRDALLKSTSDLFRQTKKGKAYGVC